jgi:hypothetical protein
MSHEITALVAAEPIDVDKAARLDLRARLVHEHVTVLPIDYHYSAYWAARRGVPGHLDVPAGLNLIFPREFVLLDLVREITSLVEPRFAIIQTEYFTAGNQWAVAFRGSTRLTGQDASINDALAVLGVRAAAPLDEFDTIGLGGYRGNPDYLDAYLELCDELGV